MKMSSMPIAVIMQRRTLQHRWADEAWAAVQTTGVAITGTPMPGVAPSVTGVSANTITGTPAGQSAASPGGGAAPRSPQALQSATVPIKSETLGTAAPSLDVKKEQTRSVKAGASPGVDRGNAKEVKNQ